jgi:protease I
LRALIVAGQGNQDSEFIYPFHRLQEAGYEVTVLTANDGPCTGIAGTKIEPCGKFAEMRFLHTAFLGPRLARPDVLVIPGGVKAMEHMRLHDGLVKFIAKYHESGGVIASMCSGAQLLISSGIVKGRTISAYQAMRVDVENAGAYWHPGPVVECDRIVTAPHYDFLGPWMAAVLKAVQSNEFREGAACAAAL